MLSVLLMAAAMLAPVFAAEHFEGRPEIVDADTFLSFRLRGGEGHPHRS